MGNAHSHPSSDARSSSHHPVSAPNIPQKSTPSSFLPFPETDENGIAIRDPLEAPKAVTVPERSLPLRPTERDVHFVPWPKRPASTSDEEDVVAKTDPPDAPSNPPSEMTEPSPHRRRSASPARRSLRKVRKTIANAAHRVDHFFNPPLRDTSSDSKWLAAGMHLPKVPVLLEGCADLGTHHLYVDKVLRDVQGRTGEEGLKVAGFEYRTVRCGEHEEISLCALTEEDDTVGMNDDAVTSDGGGSAAAEAVGGEAQEASPPKTEQKCPSKTSSLETIGLGSAEGDEANEERGVDCISAAMVAVEPEEGTSSNLPPAKGHSAADVVQSVCSASLAFECQSRMDDEGGASTSSLTVPLATAEAAVEASLSPSGSNALPPLPADCPACSTRLFHVSTNTMITLENRRRYIADGKMYDEIARLCQEFAQQLMRTEGSLEWVTICDDASKGQQPIRALVDRAHHLAEVEGNVFVTEDADMDGGEDSNDLEEGDQIIDTAKNGSTEGTADSDASRTPMLLIATGKGKVRAGIFSRQHLLTTGIEPSTALPMVREAKRRGIRCAILDPNARGDKEGMLTFERSVRAIFGHDDEGNGDDGRAVNLSPRSGDRSATESVEAMDVPQPPCHRHCHRRRRSLHPTYVLAHSAAGAHLVRYLKKHMPHALPSIAAVAFTDSTHNIQWTRDSPHLCDFLQSERTVYVRSSEGYRAHHGEGRPAGEEVCTDEHWRRRFGSVRTLWAGTGEHSLANWYSHQHIWDHFDRNRLLSSSVDEDSRVGHETSPLSRGCAGGGASRAGMGAGRHPGQWRHSSGADTIVGNCPPGISVTRDRHGRPLSPITV